MSEQFYHHPDGYITISDGSNTLSNITLAEFLTYEPAYALPAGYDAQNYIPLVKHTLWKGGKQYGGDLPDTELDGYIASVAGYINEHENPVKTLPEAKADKIAALASYSAAKKAGYVLLFAKTLPSLPLDANQIISYNEAGAVPGGFYLLDTSSAHVTLTLAELLEYNDGIVQLHRLCTVNYDTHAAAINALGTVELVDAYDFETGWPTVPYTPV